MKIIMIDNYDSFANTIAAYFTDAGADVTIYKSDCQIDVIGKVIADEKTDLIILGPGPNGPKDAGNYLEIIKRFHKTIPIFGICLGFQTMMEYFGMPVKKLENVMHGDSCIVEHCEKGIFKGIKKNEEFARYNSLGVTDVPEYFEVTARSENIIMAAKHKLLPIEGIQFHPESLLSMQNEAGKKLIKNILIGLK